MRNIAFPAWSAPLLGIVVGAFLGLRAWFASGQSTDAYMQICMSTLIGVIAGVLIWFFEPRQQPSIDDEVIPESEAFRVSLLDHGTVLTRLGALLALATSWIPFLGFVFGTFAAITNRGVYGWPSRVSNWAALIGILSSVVFVAVKLSHNR